MILLMIANINMKNGAGKCFSETCHIFRFYSNGNLGDIFIVKKYLSDNLVRNK